MCIDMHKRASHRISILRDSFVDKRGLKCDMTAVW